MSEYTTDPVATQEYHASRARVKRWVDNQPPDKSFKNPFSPPTIVDSEVGRSDQESSVSPSQSPSSGPRNPIPPGHGGHHSRARSPPMNGGFTSSSSRQMMSSNYPWVASAQVPFSNPTGMYGQGGYVTSHIPTSTSRHAAPTFTYQYSPGMSPQQTVVHQSRPRRRSHPPVVTVIQHPQAQMAAPPSYAIPQPTMYQVIRPTEAAPPKSARARTILTPAGAAGSRYYSVDVDGASGSDSTEKSRGRSRNRNVGVKTSSQGQGGIVVIPSSAPTWPPATKRSASKDQHNNGKPSLLRRLFGLGPPRQEESGRTSRAGKRRSHTVARGGQSSRRSGTTVNRRKTIS